MANIVLVSALFFCLCFINVLSVSIIPEYQATKNFETLTSYDDNPDYDDKDDPNVDIAVPRKEQPVIIGIPEDMVKDKNRPIWFLPNKKTSKRLTRKPKVPASDDTSAALISDDKLCLFGICIGGSGTIIPSDSGSSDDDTSGSEEDEGPLSQGKLYIPSRRRIPIEYHVEKKYFGRILKEKGERSVHLGHKEGYRHIRENPDVCSIHEVTAYCGARCWSKLKYGKHRKHETRRCMTECVSILKENCEEGSRRRKRVKGFERGLNVKLDTKNALQEAKILDVKLHGRSW